MVKDMKRTDADFEMLVYPNPNDDRLFFNFKNKPLKMKGGFMK